MIPVPSGVRVWLAVGRTDMRRGMNGLALQVQEALRRDPQTLLLHQQVQRPVAAATGRDFKHAGLDAIGIDDGPHAESLQQAAPGDVLGQFLDRNASLDVPDVGLAEHQHVEGDVARGRQSDFLCSCHQNVLRTGGRKTLFRSSKPVTKRSAALSL